MSPAPPAPPRSARDAFLGDVLAGLRRAPRALPSKYLYDAEGGRLFEAITGLDAYYPTRTERAILEAHAPAMAREVGPEAAVVEYGSGSSAKTGLLLGALGRPAAYVPVDISADALGPAAARVRAAFPALPVRPVEADYTRPFRLPPLPAHAVRLAFFPGSTVGNFEPPETTTFLAGVARTVGPGGLLLVGADQRKDPAVLLRAYDDEEGVTARFNLNLLRRLRRELGAELDEAAWAHRAAWDAARGRIEMHLVSLREQAIRLRGQTFAFRAGETIHTESAYKYAPDGLAALAAPAGWTRRRRWTDGAGLFAVELYARADSP